MIVVEWNGRPYRVGDIYLEQKPHDRGYFYIHDLSDTQFKDRVALVSSTSVKFLYLEPVYRGDFCKDADLAELKRIACGILREQ